MHHTFAETGTLQDRRLDRAHQHVAVKGHCKLIHESWEGSFSSKYPTAEPEALAGEPLKAA